MPAILVLCLPLAACTRSPAPHATAPRPFLVPMAVQTGSDAPAGQILPTNSLAEAYYPRGERMVYSTNIIVEGSAFSDYTYDAQPIGAVNGVGYRYRYVLRQGFTFP